jgi:hypothetical protein
MSDIAEVALLTLLAQLQGAALAYLNRIAPLVTDPYAKAGVAVGQQLLTNAGTALTAGLSAANAEFSVANAEEVIVQSTLSGLPPIT